MKKIFYKMAVPISALTLVMACSKNDVKKEITIDAKNLTPCPIGNTCLYLFTEQADINDTTAFLKTGAYRIFWNTGTYPGASRSLYIKALMQGTSFKLTKADIIAGRVVTLSQCPACYSIPLKPVDGFVKGINTTPGKRADQAKWLLEANVILQQVGGVYRDTIYIKQYFGANFVID